VRSGAIVYWLDFSPILDRGTHHQRGHWSWSSR
jgi:hypothetical protein